MESRRRVRDRAQRTDGTVERRRRSATTCLRTGLVTMRRVCSLLISAAVVLTSGQVCAADHRNSSPVRLVLPFPPGGGSDTLARILAPRLSESMGQQWVVDNRSGAAGKDRKSVV